MDDFFGYLGSSFGFSGVQRFFNPRATKKAQQEAKEAFKEELKKALACGAISVADVKALELKYDFLLFPKEQYN